MIVLSQGYVMNLIDPHTSFISLDSWIRNMTYIGKHDICFTL